MGLGIEQDDGQTPLDEDEKEGLLIATITTRGELDEFEQHGVERAIQWTLQRKVGLPDILTEDFVRSLHRRMFQDVWRWAGRYRTSNKNLGVDKSRIPADLRNLLDDCRYWIEKRTYDEDEIAVRFSHRLVSIHPFANGNGRHSRLIADVLVSNGLGQPQFSWGSVNLTTKGAARSAYLLALKRADQGEMLDLIRFARQ